MNPTDACPCESGKTFAECHGVEPEPVDLHGQHWAFYKATDPPPPSDAFPGAPGSMPLAVSQRIAEWVRTNRVEAVDNVEAWDDDGIRESIQKAHGRVIRAMRIVKRDENKSRYDDADALRVEFDDGSTLTIADRGQSCCEHRHMGTDDDMAYLAGSTFLGAETREVEGARRPDDEDDDGLGCDDDRHDIVFLVIHTSKGDVTFENHNEHNGYYGGFNVKAEFVPATAVG